MIMEKIHGERYGETVTAADYDITHAADRLAEFAESIKDSVGS